MFSLTQVLHKVVFSAYLHTHTYQTSVSGLVKNHFGGICLIRSNCFFLKDIYQIWKSYIIMYYGAGISLG